MFNAISNAVGQVVEGVVDGALGIQHGQVQLALDRFSFTGGDVVSGTVHMQCFIPFHARGVVVTLRGYESAAFEQLKTLPRDPNDPPDRPARTELLVWEETREMFEQKIRVFPQEGTVQPGSYQFPFSYQLPASLPGAFYETGGEWNKGTGYRAEIIYFAEAKIDVAYKSNIRHEVRLVINEKFDRALAPSFSQKKKSFMFTKGTLTAKVWLDHNVYFPGNTVVAKLEANNTSTKPTNRVTVKVFKTLKLMARGQRWSDRQRVYVSPPYKGFEPCFYGVRFLPFQIPVHLMPSTKTGRHVQCRYDFVVECAISGALDLDVLLDCTIMAPQYMFADQRPDLPSAPQVPGEVNYRPPWQPDKDAAACTKCQAGFSLFKRRHHCRHCGKLFCAGCTPATTMIKNLGYDEEAVRVCVDCAPKAQAGGEVFQEAPTNWNAAPVAELAWQPPTGVAGAQPTAMAPNAPASTAMAGSGGAGAGAAGAGGVASAAAASMSVAPAVAAAPAPAMAAAPAPAMAVAAPNQNMSVTVHGTGAGAADAAAAAHAASAAAMMGAATMAAGATMATAAAMPGVSVSVTTSGSSSSAAGASMSMSGGGAAAPAPAMAAPAAGMAMAAPAPAVAAGMAMAAPAPAMAAPAAGMAMAAPLDAGAFAALKAQIKDEAFSTSKMGVLNGAAATNTFTSRQVYEIVHECFDFAKDGVQAAETLYPRTVDQQNYAAVVLPAFTFASDQERLRNKLGLPKA